VHWEEGRFIHTQCFTQDISERKRAAAALEESHQFNQTVLDSMSEHIAVLDREGQIVAVNRAWKQFAQGNNATANSPGVDMGVNYLNVYRKAGGPFTDDSQAISEGIEAVLKGS
jgi:transcriptional regulator with PAS, ATPase and Fis domain